MSPLVRVGPRGFLGVPLGLPLGFLGASLGLPWGYVGTIQKWHTYVGGVPVNHNPRFPPSTPFLMSWGDAWVVLGTPGE